MEKTRLNLADLTVETFELGEDGTAAERGTVHGHLRGTDIRVCPTGADCWTDDEAECFNTSWSNCAMDSCHTCAEGCLTADPRDCF